MTTTLARQLAETVGADHLLEDPAACAAYALRAALPALVVAPGSVAELAQVLAAAFEHGAAVVPWGGGTRQRMGAPAAAGEAPLIVVRTTRLDRVLEYEPADLTISVEAGITMAALRAALAANSQMLPVDVALPARSTLGGVLATAADGPRRLGYGTLRDLMIGVRVVESTGRVSKAGGMTVKNVSGFDMMKLYLGSLGTLAVIAGANFKLIPQPRAAATICCGFDTQAAAFALVDAIHASQLTPVAVEYIEPARLIGHDSALIVRAEGLPAAVERHIRDVTQLAGQAGAAEVRTLRDAAHEAIWAQLADLPQLAELAEGEMVVRLTCLPSELAAALSDAAALAGRHGLALGCDARALSGVAYLRLQSAGGWQPLQDWHGALSARWPNLMLLAGPADLPPALEHWGRAPAGLEVMRRIKQEFDPGGRLNPGRYVV